MNPRDRKLKITKIKKIIQVNTAIYLEYYQ